MNRLNDTVIVELPFFFSSTARRRVSKRAFDENSHEAFPQSHSSAAVNLFF